MVQYQRTYLNFCVNICYFKFIARTRIIVTKGTYIIPKSRKITMNSFAKNTSAIRRLCSQKKKKKRFTYKLIFSKIECVKINKIYLFLMIFQDELAALTITLTHSYTPIIILKNEFFFLFFFCTC